MMLQSLRCPCLAPIGLLLLLLIAFTRTAISKETPSASSVNSISAVRTCPSRTFNHITHTLLQQCLRTSRSSLGASLTTAARDSGKPPVETGPSSSPSTPTPAAPESNGTPSQYYKHTQITSELTAPPSTSSTAAATTFSSESASVSVEADQDSDSPLDNAHFLSFEEWKKQNLAKAGQSAEHVGERRNVDYSGEPRRRPGAINNALDSFGEDGEIDLDFGGFVSSPSYEGQRPDNKHRNPGQRKSDSVSENDGDENDTLGSLNSRAQMAGKTSKDRFNYASFDCAATVLKNNAECKGSSSILVENKDSYMLTECSAQNKFIIVELCEDILVDTVVLANFEFFSSMFRTVRVSVSGTYPVKIDRWKTLGTFEGQNSRAIQAFPIESPLIWARYLRVEFLTHYGNEYYCPLSLLRIHGTTMMEEFKNQGDGVKPDDELDVPEAAVEPLLDEQLMTASDEQNTELTGQDASMPSSTQATAGSASESPDGGSVQTLQEQSKHPHLALYELETIIFASRCSSIEALVSSKPDHVMPLPPPVSTAAHSTLDPKASVVHSPNEVKPQAQNYTVESQVISSTVQVNLPVRPSNQTSTESFRPISSVTGPPTANPTTQESFFKTIHKRLQLLESNSTLSLQYIEEQSRILREAFTKVEKRQMSKATAFLENLNSTVVTEIRGYRQMYDQILQSTIIELENQRERTDRELLAVSSRLSIVADEILFQKRLSIVQSVLLLLCLGLILFSRSNAAQSYLELPLVQSMLSRSQSSLRPPFESPPDSPASTRPNTSRQEHRSFLRNRHRQERSDSSVEDTLSHHRRDGTRSPGNLRPLTPLAGHNGQLDSSPERDNADSETYSSVESNHSTAQPTPIEGSPERWPSDGRPPRTQSSPATPSGTRREKQRPDTVSAQELLRPESPLRRLSRAKAKSPLRWSRETHGGLKDAAKSDDMYDKQESFEETDSNSSDRCTQYPTPPRETDAQ